MARIAVLEMDEQSVRRIARLIDQGFCGDGVAVELVDNGGGCWRVAFYARTAADVNEARDLIAAATGSAAATLRFQPLSAKDWVRESLAGLPPVRAGRFVVHGAHDRAGVAPNRIGIEIEAALAFGTGHHGTTRGCLLALDRICKMLNRAPCKVHRHPEVRAKRASKGDGPGRHPSRRALGARLRMMEPHVLDLGTGSGVLAVAAARALRQRVLATDVDAQAVRAARANARLNRVGTSIAVVQADGVTNRCVRVRAPFDLIFANILLAPLQRLAAPLIRLAAPSGRVILSGLLASQANAALSAYRPLALERRIDLDGWTTLVLRCPIRH